MIHIDIDMIHMYISRRSVLQGSGAEPAVDIHNFPLKFIVALSGGRGGLQKPKPSPPVHAPGKICASSEGYSPQYFFGQYCKSLLYMYTESLIEGEGVTHIPVTPPPKFFVSGPGAPWLSGPDWVIFHLVFSIIIVSLLTLYKSLFKCRLFYTLSLVYRKSTNHIWLQYTNPSTQISDEWCNIMNHFRRFLLGSGIISQQFVEKMLHFKIVFHLSHVSRAVMSIYNFIFHVHKVNYHFLCLSWKPSIPGRNDETFFLSVYCIML